MPKHAIHNRAGSFSNRSPNHRDRQEDNQFLEVQPAHLLVKRKSNKIESPAISRDPSPNKIIP
jgi:hypothetical protein